MQLLRAAWCPGAPQVARRLLAAYAAALVGAGVLSVLVYPAVAAALARKDGSTPEPGPEPDAAALTPRARHPADGLMPWHR